MLKLPKNINVNDSHSLREMLEKGVEGSDLIEIDLSGVEFADTSGAQLLISAKATIEAAGKSVLFSGQSQALEDACERIGLPTTEFQSEIPSPNE